MTTATIEFKGQQHRSPADAMTDLADDMRAILVGGRYYTLEAAELCRVQLAGFQPTILTYNEAAGVIMTVPGRHA